MELGIICFTKRGLDTARKLVIMIDDQQTGELYPDELLEEFGAVKCRIYVKGSAADAADGETVLNTGIGDWAGEQMRGKNALIFVGAVGIAVRTIAPHIEDKLSDSPVIVIDEAGAFCIPILSGHMGGANALASFISRLTGAIPVITTATDINKRFAADIFAKRNKLFITDKDGIKKISAKALSGERITISVEGGHLIGDDITEDIVLKKYPPYEYVDVAVTSENADFDAGLVLKPRLYAVGVGCRKGIPHEKFEEFVNGALEKAGINPGEVAVMASVDLKSGEKAINAYCKKYSIPFVCFSPEELMRVEGDFSHSDFVMERTGADNVCERAAALAAAEIDSRMRKAECEDAPGDERADNKAYEFVLRKTKEDGMTLAVCRTDWMISLAPDTEK